MESFGATWYRPSTLEVISFITTITAGFAALILAIAQSIRAERNEYPMLPIKFYCCSVVCGILISATGWNYFFHFSAVMSLFTLYLFAVYPQKNH